MNKATEINFVKDNRELRARRFANQMLNMMKDFIPDVCRRDAYEILFKEAFKLNIEIINVPPECDHLEKLDFERKMYETMINKNVTLAEFLKLSPSEQCKVQHLDLSFASEEDRAKMRSLKEGKNHE